MPCCDGPRCSEKEPKKSSSEKQQCPGGSKKSQSSSGPTPPPPTCEGKSCCSACVVDVGGSASASSGGGGSATEDEGGGGDDDDDGDKATYIEQAKGRIIPPKSCCKSSKGSFLGQPSGGGTFKAAEDDKMPASACSVVVDIATSCCTSPVNPPALKPRESKVSNATSCCPSTVNRPGLEPCESKASIATSCCPSTVNPPGLEPCESKASIATSCCPSTVNPLGSKPYEIKASIATSCCPSTVNPPGLKPCEIKASIATSCCPSTVNPPGLKPCESKVSSATSCCASTVNPPGLKPRESKASISIDTINEHPRTTEEIPRTWVKLRLKVSGMTCTSCEKTLLDAMREGSYTKPIGVSLFSNTADLAYDQQATSAEEIVQYLIKKTGFQCEVEHVASATVARYHVATTDSMVAKTVSIVDVQPGVINRTLKRQGRTDQYLLEIEFDADLTGPRTLLKGLIGADIDAKIFKQEDSADHGQEEIRFWGMRLALSTLLCIPVIVLVYAIPDSSANIRVTNNLDLWTVLAAIFTTPIQFYAAGPIHSAAWTTLKSKKVEMDMLVTLSTSVAYIYSIVVLVILSVKANSSLEPFFETAALLVTLVILGRYITALARGKASNAIAALRGMQPDTALLAIERTADSKDYEEGEEIDVDLLQRGDVVVIRPSSQIPADGIVVAGRADVDESMITGEPVPVMKETGARVVGGSLTSGGILFVRVTHVPSEGVLSGLQRMVQEAQASRAPAQALADRIAAVFTPAVLVIAGIVFVIWLSIGMAGQWTSDRPPAIEALLYAIAVLIVSCPCAVGLAVPTVIVVATGVAAQRGILFKNGGNLEAAAGLDVVVFDKTGTLTSGTFAVVSETYVKDDTMLEEIRSTILTIATLSEHILARAIADHLKKMETSGFSSVSHVVSQPGLGIQGTVNGVDVRLGRPSWVAENIHDRELDAALHLAKIEGCSVVAASINGVTVAIYRLSDSIRVDAKEAVDFLISAGTQVHILSGDLPDTVRRLAQTLGIEAANAIGGCLPADKLLRLKALQYSGHRIAFVGDGSNDAPGLAQADVGIAFGSGTDLAMSTAGVILLQPRVMGVPDVLVIAKSARRTIKANFSWAFLYNVAAILLAAGAFTALGGVRIPPALAGLGELVSVLPVIIFSMILRKQRWPSASRGN
ncbi:E1-E2 ATPase-domain-containing protein [Powellomyces hirtus]|nr:E1-E2 ATPase-domain-containing protein [Powellomyces hirtus]